MRFTDEELIVTSARIALDVGAIGEALLEGDGQEARFRLTLLTGDARSLGQFEVSQAAMAVLALLPTPDTAKPGIGSALVHLCDTIETLA